MRPAHYLTGTQTTKYNLLGAEIKVITKMILKNLTTKLKFVIPAKAGIHYTERWIPAKNVRE
jgi:hypothetical protein